MSDDFRGTPLDAEDFEKGKVLFTRDEPKAEYAWDTGVAIGRYLQELKNGRLIARNCVKCRRVMIPPRMHCEWCWRPTDDWVYVQDRGLVNTFSLCYITWDMQRLKTPEIPAVIEIEGASPGHGIMHKLGGVDPKKVKVGMKVKAVWKPAEERVGSILDILHWAPT
ncbi:MAG: OB-fold domain-containing protein [Planctomycetes bacterium]|nr:OB-fold domain-containing protein [Planctomycetota bacterium]